MGLGLIAWFVGYGWLLLFELGVGVGAGFGCFVNFKLGGVGGVCLLGVASFRWLCVLCFYGVLLMLWW